MKIDYLIYGLIAAIIVTLIIIVVLVVTDKKNKKKASEDAVTKNANTATDTDTTAESIQENAVINDIVDNNAPEEQFEEIEPNNVFVEKEDVSTLNEEQSMLEETNTAEEIEEIAEPEETEEITTQIKYCNPKPTRPSTVVSNPVIPESTKAALEAPVFIQENSFISEDFEPSENKSVNSNSSSGDEKSTHTTTKELGFVSNSQVYEAYEILMKRIAEELQRRSENENKVVINYLNGREEELKYRDERFYLRNEEVIINGILQSNLSEYRYSIGDRIVIRFDVDITVPSGYELQVMANNQIIEQKHLLVQHVATGDGGIVGIRASMFAEEAGTISKYDQLFTAQVVPS